MANNKVLFDLLDLSCNKITIRLRLFDKHLHLIKETEPQNHPDNIV